MNKFPQIKMKQDDEHLYHVIQFLQIPYYGVKEYVCVPHSWLRSRRKTDRKVFVSYPSKHYELLTERVKKGYKFHKGWKLYLSIIKFSTDSYDEAENYIATQIKKSSKDKWSSKESEDIIEVPSLTRKIRHYRRNIIMPGSMKPGPCGPSRITLKRPGLFVTQENVPKKRKKMIKTSEYDNKSQDHSKKIFDVPLDSDESSLHLERLTENATMKISSSGSNVDSKIYPQCDSKKTSDLQMSNNLSNRSENLKKIYTFFDETSDLNFRQPKSSLKQPAKSKLPQLYAQYLNPFLMLKDTSKKGTCNLPEVKSNLSEGSQTSSTSTFLNKQEIIPLSNKHESILQVSTGRTSSCKDSSFPVSEHLNLSKSLTVSQNSYIQFLKPERIAQTTEVQSQNIPSCSNNYSAVKSMSIPNVLPVSHDNQSEIKILKNELLGKTLKGDNKYLIHDCSQSNKLPVVLANKIDAKNSVQLPSSNTIIKTNPSLQIITKKNILSNSSKEPPNVDLNSDFGNTKLCEKSRKLQCSSILSKTSENDNIKRNKKKLKKKILHEFSEMLEKIHRKFTKSEGPRDNKYLTYVEYDKIFKIFTESLNTFCVSNNSETNETKDANDKSYDTIDNSNKNSSSSESDDDFELLHTNLKSARWTLKHIEYKPGLVELMPDTEVYIDAKALGNCKKSANNYKTLAKLLLPEIFTQTALSTCAFAFSRGNSNATDEVDLRPSLHRFAKIILLTYVEEYGRRRGWGPFDLSKIEMILNNKMDMMRRQIKQ